ncbi:MAG: folate-binding protein [Rubrivivax sp.]|nr:folate-binding protein [Rubrivivax sp.]
MHTPLPTPALPQGCTRLSDWGLIRASGLDAASFLHGQLTQDMTGLDPQRARLAGFCSVKGRLQASFVVWRQGPEEIWLLCSADLLAPTLKRLSMFVMRAKCKLSDASAEVALWGLAGDAAANWLGERAPATPWSRQAEADTSALRLPDAVVDGQPVARYLWAAPAAAAAPALPALDTDAWQWLEVHSGVARIVAATAEQFVPQMVNFELVGGVNFQNGCFPGQEVVARSQYRGTLKRRLFVADAAAPLAPGQELFHSADPEQPAGMVVLAGQASGRHAVLVELKLTATGGGQLHAGSADGPLLTLGSLPYAMPVDGA